MKRFKREHFGAAIWLGVLVALAFLGAPQPRDAQAQTSSTSIGQRIAGPGFCDLDSATTNINLLTTCGTCPEDMPIVVWAEIVNLGSNPIGFKMKSGDSPHAVSAFGGGYNVISTFQFTRPSGLFVDTSGSLSGSGGVSITFGLTSIALRLGCAS